jgi:predicted TIM-barrel fold metal-dependent hydrolase
MTPEAVAILVLILGNLAGLASILRLQSQLRETRECLGWAERFVLGSNGPFDRLKNPKFHEWLVRCNQASGYPYGERTRPTGGDA